MSSALRVLRAGALTTVQDGGRPGLAHLGVPPSGAADHGAWQLANRLVGNPPDAAALETTLDGTRLRAEGRCLVAVTGAPADVSVDGRPAAWGATLAVPDGADLSVGRAVAGLRGYIAVAGGLRVGSVLGSAAHDLLSGLGPQPLHDGDLLHVGTAAGPPPAVDTAPQPAPPQRLRLTLWEGPRADWLSDAGRVALGRERWTVSSDSNRVGLRLDGPALPLALRQQLRSEGLVCGAVQVPPSGRPMVFLRDHPTTGGYPVIGVVDAADLDRCAQAVPGTPVHFAPRAVAWAARRR